MATPLQAAQAAAASCLDQLAAVPATYRRGEDLTIELTVLPGRDVTQRDRLTGAVAKQTRADSWLADPADLVDGDDNPVIPQQGDLLTIEPDTARERTYRVTGDQNTPPWTWTGPAHQWRRIRTEPTATA